MLVIINRHLYITFSCINTEILQKYINITCIYIQHLQKNIFTFNYYFCSSKQFMWQSCPYIFIFTLSFADYQISAIFLKNDVSIVLICLDLYIILWSGNFPFHKAIRVARENYWLPYYNFSFYWCNLGGILKRQYKAILKWKHILLQLLSN